MSAVFERASERTRTEPVPSLEACTVKAINRSYQLGITSGDRRGYLRGWVWGLLCGACLGIYVGVLATLAVQRLL